MPVLGLAVISATLCVASWYAGIGAEKFLASKYCTPFARRCAYACLVVAVGQGIFAALRGLLT